MDRKDPYVQIPAYRFLRTASCVRLLQWLPVNVRIINRV